MPIHPVLILVLALIVPQSLLAEPPRFQAWILQRFPSADAYQGIAVDADYFYAINNRQISKHVKHSGALVGQLDAVDKASGTLIHLDGGVVLDGELYTAHSNYPGMPMRSSVEVFDAEALRFKRRHEFGVFLGSMTWLDRFGSGYWGAFGNYDIAGFGSIEPYGGTRNTVIVRFDQQFNVQQQWRLPEEIIERMVPMSNSGGSWGADGFLYLTGHDHPEIYVMAAPDESATLIWIATVDLPGLDGQGIAWDRSIAGKELWAILRSSREVLRIGMPTIAID